MKLTIASSGDAALFCRLGKQIDTLVSDSVLLLNRKIKAAGLEGLIETVPSYTGIMVYYNNNITGAEELTRSITILANDQDSDTFPRPSFVIDVPVCYNEQYGPDLEYVASYCDMSIQDLIRIHTSQEYRIHMLGFTPGFPYLGGMDKQIATPRKKTPRTKIRAGSVGIAGEQTGIYPIDSPGGWQLIGRTPLKLIDFTDAEPFLFKAGDHLRFRAVSPEEYFEIAETLREGKYRIEKSVRV